MKEFRRAEAEFSSWMADPHGPQPTHWECRFGYYASVDLLEEVTEVLK